MTAEIAVIADCPAPVPPCGGCRQKLLELGNPDVKVTMASMNGKTSEVALAELLPGGFDATQME